MAQMNGMEKRNFTNSVRNGGKMAEMWNNSAKSGMVAMSGTDRKLCSDVVSTHRQVELDVVDVLMVAYAV